jgi:hypothetical protein
MDFLPTSQQEFLVFVRDLHRAAHLATAHAIGPDQVRSAIGAAQIDLGLAIAEDMHMRGLVIVRDMSTRKPQARNTVTMLPLNPTGWVFQEDACCYLAKPH